MTNIRFPLKKPTSGHPNPYTIDFDFLPNPLVSWNNLNTQQRENLYTTQIRINDTEAESSKIQHVFPNGVVYFIINYGYNSSISQITSNILYDSLTHEIFGTWIHVGEIKDIKDVRNTVDTCFIPTAVVYDSVTLTPHILSIIKNYLSVQFNVSKVFNHDTELFDKINGFLSGKIRIRLSDDDVDNGLFLMPSVTTRGSFKELRLGAIMMDGNGIEKSTIVSLVSLLKHNSSNGKLFDPEHHDTQKMIVASPINTFLASSFHLNRDNEHPYKKLIDINNPNIITRHIWDAIVFYKGTPSTIARARFNLYGYNNKMVKIEEDNYEFPLHRSGIFYYPSLSNKSLSLNQTSGTFNLYIVANRALTEGAFIRLTSDKKRQNYYSVGFGPTPQIQISENNREKYFGIEPTIDNLMSFFERLSQNHFVTLTSAGVFARAMGFLAEAIGHYFENSFGKFVIDQSNGLIVESFEISLKKEKTGSVFLAGCYYLFFYDEQRTYPFASYEILSKITGNFKSKLDAVYNIWNNDSWLKTHEDHSDDDLKWGWKTWDNPFDGGHKHHFIYNACAVNSVNLIASVTNNIMEDLWPEKWGGEDQEIDRKFNEMGRDFGYWILLDYEPSNVYQKVKELIVDNEFIQ